MLANALDFNQQTYQKATITGHLADFHQELSHPRRIGILVFLRRHIIFPHLRKESGEPSDERRLSHAGNCGGFLTTNLAKLATITCPMLATATDFKRQT